MRKREKPTRRDDFVIGNLVCMVEDHRVGVLICRRSRIWMIEAVMGLGMEGRVGLDV